MQHWEYKIIYLTGETLKEDVAKLNELGNDGWELVSAGMFSEHTHDQIAYMKRMVDDGRYR